MVFSWSASTASRNRLRSASAFANVPEAETSRFASPNSPFTVSVVGPCPDTRLLTPTAPEASVAPLENEPPARFETRSVPRLRPTVPHISRSDDGFRPK